MNNCALKNCDSRERKSAVDSGSLSIGPEDLMRKNNQIRTINDRIHAWGLATLCALVVASSASKAATISPETRQAFSIECKAIFFIASESFRKLPNDERYIKYKKKSDLMNELAKNDLKSMNVDPTLLDHYVQRHIIGIEKMYNLGQKDVVSVFLKQCDNVFPDSMLENSNSPPPEK